MTFEILLLNRKMAELQKRLRDFDTLITKIKEAGNNYHNGDIVCKDFVAEIKSHLEKFEMSKPARQSTYIGNWHSRDRTFVTIEKEFELDGTVFFLGYITWNGTARLASVWDSNGNNLGNSNYDLTERIRPGKGL